MRLVFHFKLGNKLSESVPAMFVASLLRRCGKRKFSTYAWLYALLRFSRKLARRVPPAVTRLTVYRWLHIPAQGSRLAHTARNIARYFGRSFALGFAFLCGKALSCSKLVGIYIRNILTRGRPKPSVWIGSFRGPSAEYFDHDVDIS